MKRTLHSKLVSLVIACVSCMGAACSVDEGGTGKKYKPDAQLPDDGGHVMKPDGGKPDVDSGGTAGTGSQKPDAAKPGMDSGMEPGMDGSMGMDAGVDAYIPPPPPPPPRLSPHLAGGGFARSQGFRLYHSVGAPRPTNSLTPRAMSESTHYRLNSGLAVTSP
jgi:hypothetical protein